MKIMFFCNWKKNKAKTWSGTPYFLFNALKKYAEVIDYDLHLSPIEELQVSLKKLVFKMFGKHDARTLEIDMLSKKVERQSCLDYKDILFTFETLNFKNKRAYLYVDLTVEYLRDLMKSDKYFLLKYSPIRLNVSKKDLNKRLELNKKFYSSCGGVFTMSKWLCEYMVNKEYIPKTKIHYVGGGCNIDVSSIDESKKNGRRFLFVGIDWERKNGSLVIKAFERLSIDIPEIELYIIGPKKRLFNKNISNVHYLGNLDYSQLPKYYNLCDFFVLPSKFEAYGLVFSEALIYGLPCIGTNDFSMKEFINDGFNGRLLNDINDDEELANCMKDLFENQNSYKSNVTSMRQDYIKKYSWDSVANRIVSIIKEDETYSM